MIEIDGVEKQRLIIQDSLDACKTSEDRNRMGQYATPTTLAREILAKGVSLLPPEAPIRFLDPGIGTGSFFSALNATVLQQRIESAKGFEIDTHYGEPARALWGGTQLDIQIEDFTIANPGLGKKANLLICNPPYVRHHHIDSSSKSELQNRTEAACGLRFNGLSGLYCYFIGLSHSFMAQGAIAGWLIPSEFMDVNYGQTLKRYLLNKVTLLQIHRYDPKNVQFPDALVSSSVVWIKNILPSKSYSVLFTYGGTLTEPNISREVSTLELAKEPKWTRYPQADSLRTSNLIRLSDLFDIRRGLATGGNHFFILDYDQIKMHKLPMDCFRPILPSSRYITSNEIKADKHGFPLIDKQLYLLDTRLPEEEISKRYPSLRKYLDTGKTGLKPVANSYLCRSRTPWYAQESRKAAPILCTYMGRSRNGANPFRFILNHSIATASNTFLMLYPKSLLADSVKTNPNIIRNIWEYLSKIEPIALFGHGRVYGGGLHKLEPKELCNLPADDLLSLLPKYSSIKYESSLLKYTNT